VALSDCFWHITEAHLPSMKAVVHADKVRPSNAMRSKGRLFEPYNLEPVLRRGISALGLHPPPASLRLRVIA